jgi:chromate transporter
VAVWLLRAPPRPAHGRRVALLLAAPGAAIVTGAAKLPVLAQLALFFAKAGAFVFGSGLAIVPFLYGGVVHDMHWLNDRQFLDAVAVAMITPGPVVITAGFIGYLVAGVAGAFVAAAATFLPCFLITVIGAPHFRRWGRYPPVLALIQGVTAAAMGAIAGAVIVLGRRSLVDLPTIAIALAALVVLARWKRTPEVAVVIASALVGVLLHRIVPLHVTLLH